MELKDIKYLNKFNKKRNSKFDKKNTKFKDLYNENKIQKNPYKRQNHKSLQDYLNEDDN